MDLPSCEYKRTHAKSRHEAVWLGKSMRLIVTASRVAPPDHAPDGEAKPLAHLSKETVQSGQKQSTGNETLSRAKYVRPILFIVAFAGQHHFQDALGL